MNQARALDRGFAVAVCALLAGAVVIGWDVAPARLAPAPLAFAAKTHTVVALLAWPAALVAALRLWRQAPAPGADLWQQFRKGSLGLFGLYLTLLYVLAAVLAPLLAPHDPTQLYSGLESAPPSTRFWFGTDPSGRDIFSRLLFGARVSLTIGALAVGISATVGTAVGAAAGYLGGAVDRVLSGGIDLMLSLPRLVLLLAVVGVLRPEGAARVWVIVLVLGLTGWMGVARMVRGQVLSLRERDFVAAGRALGFSEGRILLRHVLPQAAPVLVVYASLALGGTMLTEAALSFLGQGIGEPTPTWGQMASSGQAHLQRAPWIALAPALCILGAVLGVNLLGDGLRDAADPRMRGRSA